MIDTDLLSPNSASLSQLSTLCFLNSRVYVAPGSTHTFIKIYTIVHQCFGKGVTRYNHSSAIESVTRHVALVLTYEKLSKLNVVYVNEWWSGDCQYFCNLVSPLTTWWQNIGGCTTFPRACFLPRLVYPSVGRAKLLQVSSCRWKTWPCLRWARKWPCWILSTITGILVGCSIWVTLMSTRSPFRSDCLSHKHSDHLSRLAILHSATNRS